MRKQTKLVAVLSAAALLAIGASMTSMAATGWTQQDGQWYYYNNSGDYVTDSWKKSGNSYFYLGDDGAMMTNALIEDGDDYYYVDANGAMVKSQWIQIAADDDDNELDVAYRWYYFGPTGRAYTGDGSKVTKKTINGKKYAFDENGKMLFGFVDESGAIVNDDDDPVLGSTYYFGTNEDGAMHTGWLNYTEGVDDDTYDADKFDGSNSLWFYYNTSTGEKYVDKTDKKINGYKYSFDSNGVMQPEWYATGSVTATSQKYYSSTDQGWQRKDTWVWAVPSAEMDEDDNADDSYSWFYVDNKGERVTGKAKKVNGKWYAFDGIGRAQDGFVVLSKDKVNGAEYVTSFGADDVEKSDILNGKVKDTTFDAKNLYYFSDDAETDGAMKTGSSVKIDLADDTYTFGFEDDGSAKIGIDKNDKLYVNGILMDAGSDKYTAVSYNGNVYVTNSYGKIQGTKSSVKNDDGDYYAVVKYTKNANAAGENKVYLVDGSDDDASRIASAIARKDSVKLDNRGYGLAGETTDKDEEVKKPSYNFSKNDVLQKFIDEGVVTELTAAGNGFDAVPAK